MVSRKQHELCLTFSDVNIVCCSFLFKRPNDVFFGRWEYVYIRYVLELVLVSLEPNAEL